MLKNILRQDYPAFDGIMDGLVDGMNKASDLYDEEEYFVTDILLCSDAMYAGLGCAASTPSGKCARAEKNRRR